MSGFQFEDIMDADTAEYMSTMRAAGGTLPTVTPVVNLGVPTVESVITDAALADVANSKPFEIVGALAILDNVDRRLVKFLLEFGDMVQFKHDILLLLPMLKDCPVATGSMAKIDALSGLSRLTLLEAVTKKTENIDYIPVQHITGRVLDQRMADRVKTRIDAKGIHYEIGRVKFSLNDKNEVPHKSVVKILEKELEILMGKKIKIIDVPPIILYALDFVLAKYTIGISGTGGNVKWRVDKINQNANDIGGFFDALTYTTEGQIKLKATVANWEHSFTKWLHTSVPAPSVLPDARANIDMALLGYFFRHGYMTTFPTPPPEFEKIPSEYLRERKVLKEQTNELMTKKIQVPATIPTEQKASYINGKLMQGMVAAWEATQQLSLLHRPYRAAFGAGDKETKSMGTGAEGIDYRVTSSAVAHRVIKAAKYPVVLLGSDVMGDEYMRLPGSSRAGAFDAIPKKISRILDVQSSRCDFNDGNDLRLKLVDVYNTGFTQVSLIWNHQENVTNRMQDRAFKEKVQSEFPGLGGAFEYYVDRHYLNILSNLVAETRPTELFIRSHVPPAAEPGNIIVPSWFAKISRYYKKVDFLLGSRPHNSEYWIAFTNPNPPDQLKDDIALHWSWMWFMHKKGQIMKAWNYFRNRSIRSGYIHLPFSEKELLEAYSIEEVNSYFANRPYIPHGVSVDYTQYKMNEMGKEASEETLRNEYAMQGLVEFQKGTGEKTKKTQKADAEKSKKKKVDGSEMSDV